MRMLDPPLQQCQQSEAAVMKVGRQWREETASLMKHVAGSSHKGKKGAE